MGLQISNHMVFIRGADLLQALQNLAHSLVQAQGNNKPDRRFSIRTPDIELGTYRDLRSTAIENPDSRSILPLCSSRVFKSE